MAIEQVAAEVASNVAAYSKLGAGIAIGFGAIGAGLGIGIATKGMLESMARQPEIAGKAFVNFILGLGLAEATAIYALFIALQLIK